MLPIKYACTVSRNHPTQFVLLAIIILFKKMTTTKPPLNYFSIFNVKLKENRLNSIFKKVFILKKIDICKTIRM